MLPQARDDRILFACGLTLFGVGLVFATLGVALLASLPHIGESAQTLDEQARQGEVTGILPENIDQWIIQAQAIGITMVVFGAVGIAGGAVLALVFGRAALGEHFAH